MLETDPKYDDHSAMPFDAPWQAIKLTLCLSEKQLQIVQCMFLGLTEEGVARELNVSRATIHHHLAHIYRKTGVTTRMELSTHISEALTAIPADTMRN